MTDTQKLITLEPGKRAGQPCIRGLRITVQDVHAWVAAGMSKEQILADFPELTAQDVQAALAWISQGGQVDWPRSDGTSA